MPPPPTSDSQPPSFEPSTSSTSSLRTAQSLGPPSASVARASATPQDPLNGMQIGDKPPRPSRGLPATPEAALFVSGPVVEPRVSISRRRSAGAKISSSAPDTAFSGLRRSSRLLGRASRDLSEDALASAWAVVEKPLAALPAGGGSGSVKRKKAEIEEWGNPTPQPPRKKQKGRME